MKERTTYNKLKHFKIIETKLKKEKQTRHRNTEE
jgi:hypothetical protein